MRASLARRLLYVAALTGVWLLLWDRITVANAVAGVLVACVVLIVFPTARRVRDARPTVIRPLHVLVLAGYIARQLVVSNWLVAREILSRRSHIRTGIVACRLHTDTPGLVTLLANIVALSPGTMTVDARAEPPTLYVHVLMLRDVLGAKRDVAHLEHLVLRAFGTEADRIDGEVRR
jgi:multisubunit Na+/H+ antiporter MnhE subunit